MQQRAGWGNAMQILLTGDEFTAQDALRFNFVQQVVPVGQELPRALEVAERIARQAPLAVQAAKELAVRSRDVDTNTGLRMEQLMVRILRETDDAKEGPAAFREKRKPAFQGE